jgi:hypothetical protein
MMVDEKFCFKEATKLTVHKTSVFFPGDGFIVYDPNREIIFRFDSYGPDSEPKDELVLMDAGGKGLLTLRRKVSCCFFLCFFLVFQASLWKISSILQGSITVTFNLFEMIGDTTLVNRKT